MAYWLKMIGASGHTLDNDWLDTRYDLIDRVRFARNKRPTGVASGDRLVLYAAGWERFYAIAIVTTETPYRDDAEPRWPWVHDVTVPLVMPRLEMAPALAELGVAPTSVRQQSHIRLSDAQYERAFEALTQPVRP